jgi:putative phosphoesterase
MTIERPVKIALVSDTHAYICPQVLSVVERCDIAVHAGDICGKHILDELRARVGRVIAVAGNNDLPGIWADEEAETVEALPRTAEVALPGGLLAVEHGHLHGFHTPDHGKLRAVHSGAKVIVYGHTHKRMVDQSETPWVVNPGAAGEVRNYGGPSCLVVHASSEAWEIEAFKFPS